MALIIRAWDDINNRMISNFKRLNKKSQYESPNGDKYSYGIDIDDNNEIFATISKQDKENWIYYHVKRIPIMISTEQYDDSKEKKLMFDKDIVQVTDDCGNSYITHIYHRGKEYPAFDLNHKHIPSEWYYESNVLNTIFMNSNEKIEVIGNLYESPELLEKGDE